MPPCHCRLKNLSSITLSSNKRASSIYDTIIIGAGAAGLMCAITAGRRGRKVLVLERSTKAGKKILMSGGGKCNFTNLHVAPDRFLTGSDTFWGNALGNGGDWFELVVTEDHLDIRGWQIVVETDGDPASTLSFTNDAILSDLRGGTIITVSELLPSDVSYDPAGGDWWLNVRAGLGGDGLYISNTDFNVAHTNTRLTVLDAVGDTVFGPAGEGVQPLTGVGNIEVLIAVQSPTHFQDLAKHLLRFFIAAHGMHEHSQVL